MLLKESCSQEKYVKLCVWCSLCSWNKQFGFLGESPGLVLFLPHSKNITLLQTLVSPNCRFFYFCPSCVPTLPWFFSQTKICWTWMETAGKLWEAARRRMDPQIFQAIKRHLGRWLWMLRCFGGFPPYHSFWVCIGDAIIPGIFQSVGITSSWWFQPLGGGHANTPKGLLGGPTFTWYTWHLLVQDISTNSIWYSGFLIWAAFP